MYLSISRASTHRFCRPTLVEKALLDSGYRTLVCPFPETIDAQLIYAMSANAILESNLNIPVRGVAIGNGWIDPRRQYPAYLDFTVKVGILEENTEVSSY